MKWFSSLAALLALLLLATHTDAYPNESDLACRPMVAGNAYMTGSVPSTDRSLIIKRNGVALATGAKYVLGETLTYELSGLKSGQWVIDTLGGGVVSGSTRCSGTRVTNTQTGSFVMPTTNTGTVSFIYSWATGHSTVSINNAMTLTSPDGTTGAPFVAPLSSSSGGNGDSSKTTNIIVGVIVGFGCLLILAFGGMTYIELFKRDALPDLSGVPIAGVLACLFGLVSLILVTEYSDDAHYRLMAGGFFFAQVVALCVWGIVPDHKTAKVLHVLAQVAASACMIAGLVSIVKDKNDAKEPNLTSMHSWLGVAAVSLYCVNFLWGKFMGLLTACYPNSIIRKAFPMLAIHKAIGLVSFGITMCAVETGIMDATGRGGCYYTTYDGTQGVDKNPAEKYKDLPDDCQLANGLGITVLISGILVYFAVFQRNFSNPSHNSNSGPSSDLPAKEMVAVAYADEDDNNPL